MRKPGVSDSELEVLKSLWEDGPATVREVSQRMRKTRKGWAYTTVKTLLNRLEAKGYVSCDKSGFAHVFRASVSRRNLLLEGLDLLRERICDGSAAPLVRAFVETGRLESRDVEELRRLLDRLDAEREEQKP